MPKLVIVPPIVQVAIDVLNIDDALRIAEAAVKAGVDWLEVGTPLVTFCGTSAVGALSRAFPGVPVLSDYKTMDGARKYAIEARKQGGSLCTVCYQAGEPCVRSMIAGGNEAEINVVVDLINAPDPVEAGRLCEQWGADSVMLHWGADQKSADPGRDPVRDLPGLLEAVNLPVGTATWSAEDGAKAARLGTDIMIIGFPLIGMADVEGELRRYVEAVRESYCGRR